MRHPELREIFMEEHRFIDRAFDRLICRDSNCVDIGCHIGSVLSEFCKRAPDGHHVAVEAVPEKAAWLKRKFPDVDVHHCALSDHEGQITFYEDRKRPGFSGLGRSSSDGAVEEITVPCSTLDRVVEDRRVDFIKIDVEGAEELVLRGSGNVLANQRPTIVFESGPAGAEHLGLSVAGLFQYVTDELNYRVYTPRGFCESSSALTEAEFLEAHKYPFTAFNYLALPSEQEQESGRDSR
jgi:FkbM family methyltransferase